MRRRMAVAARADFVRRMARRLPLRDPHGQITGDVGRVTGRALCLGMHADQGKQVGMREPRYGAKRVLLAVARRAVGAVDAAVHVVVAAAAVVLESEKPRLSDRQRVERRVEVALVAGGCDMAAGQTEVEPGMIELRRLSDAGQRERAAVHQPEFPPVVLLVTGLAAVRGVDRQLAVQPVRRSQLCTDRLVAGETGLREIGGRRTVAALAAFRADQPRILRVHGRQLTGRRALPVGVPKPHHQQQRDRADRQRKSS